MKKDTLAVSGVSTHTPRDFAPGGCGTSFARTGYSRACERGAADRTRLTNPASWRMSLMRRGVGLTLQ